MILKNYNYYIVVRRFGLKLSLEKFAAIILLFLFSSIALWAQGGVITGKIVDAESGDILRRASVFVVGTKLGGFSDVKGEFRIKNVPAGTYSLKITYIGFVTKEVQNIAVAGDKSVSLGTIVLNAEKTTTEEVVVEATRSNDNAAAILAQRKNSAQVSDGISQEEMSKLPDSDAGQSLKRVSGVTLVDNKFVYVRGVSERYSNTTLNGASLASTEPDKKAFSFDMFPSEFLQNVNIAKSFTPDMPGNFAGGLVQLNTVDFPDGFAVKASVSSNANSNYTGQNNAFMTSPGSSSDWLAMDDGTRAMPSVMPSDRLAFNDLKRRANNPYDTTGAAAQYENIGKSFNSNLWERNNSTVGLMGNGGIGLTFTNKYHLADNDQIGVIGSFNYGTSHNLNNIERNAYLSSFDTLYKFNGTQASQSVNWGGLFNIAYKTGNHSFSFKNVYNRSADNDMVTLEGQDVGYQFLDLKNFSTQYIEKVMYSNQIGGEHSFGNASFFNNPNESILMDWRAGYSKSIRDEPDYRRVKFSRNLGDLEFEPNTPFSPEFVQTQNGDGTRVGRFFSYLDDEAYTSGFNLTIPLSTIKVKTGFLSEIRSRSFSARSFTILKPDNLDESIDTILHDWQNPQRIFDEANFRNDGGFSIGEDSKLTDSYSAQEDLYAAYFMVDAPFKLMGVDMRFIGGARYEDNLQVLDSYDQNQQPLKVDNLTQDILPSINFIVKTTDNANLRLSASQTLTRPSLREYAPFSFYDYLQQALVQGNPNLKRSLIQNYDIRYEYFPNPGEVMSLSVFYKNFENAIEETIYPQQSELTRTFANSESDAKNYGFELELRKSLGFITSALQNLAVNVNIAVINSEITVLQGGKGTSDTRQMWGQSPYTFNVGLFYMLPEWGTSFNIAYNTYGKRIIQVAQLGAYPNVEDPHIYELERDLVDLSIIQPFSNQFEIKLSVRDLLNQPLLWEQDGKRTAYNLRGTNISLGLSMTIK